MFIGNSHNYTLFGTKVIAGNVHCSKYEPNHQWFSLCQIWAKSPMRGILSFLWSQIRWKSPLSQICAKSPIMGSFFFSDENVHCPKYEPNHQWGVFLSLAPDHLKIFIVPNMSQITNERYFFLWSLYGYLTHIWDNGIWNFFRLFILRV